jgi:hypothetical protein
MAGRTGLGGRRLAAIAATLMLALVPVACGGDDDEGDGEEAPGPTEITVTAGEYFFELSDTPTAGENTFRLVNEGAEPHAMILAKINPGFTLEEAFKLQGEKGSVEELGTLNAPPGEDAKKTVTAELEPGENYAMVCPVQTKESKKPHFFLGQREEFTVE